MSLIVVIVALGISSIVIMSMLSLINSSFKEQNRLQISIDAEDLKEELKLLFKNTAQCNAVYVATSVDTSSTAIANHTYQRVTNINCNNLFFKCFKALYNRSRFFHKKHIDVDD
ncbi:MAG: hypothetical protein KDD58_00745 [Bdellovibrionales bacterium]|nr:hypothetical protein [Bdellovibrionales bacterium]